MPTERSFAVAEFGLQTTCPGVGAVAGWLQIVLLLAGVVAAAVVVDLWYFQTILLLAGVVVVVDLWYSQIILRPAVDSAVVGSQTVLRCFAEDYSHQHYQIIHQIAEVLVVHLDFRTASR